jgi:hypothetical protein
MAQDPKKITSILLVVIVLTVGWLDYWSNSQASYRDPRMWMDVVEGTAHAPAQYRLGVIDTAYFLTRHTHLGLRHTLTLLDVIAAFIAVFVLFMMLRRSAVYREAGTAGQWFGAAGFVILVQFYLAWLLWYQRPETLATAAILALALMLLTVPLGRGAGVAVIGFLILAAAQAFVRADVGFALHLGILLVCLTPIGRGFALSRRVQVSTSLVALLIVMGIQFWLMRRAFPHADYGGTKVVQLLVNLTSPRLWMPFLLFIGPFAWTLWTVVKRRYLADPADAAMLVGAVIFSGMWLVVGLMAEVRIFMPFALALTPLTTQIVMQQFLPIELRGTPKSSLS